MIVLGASFCVHGSELLRCNEEVNHAFAAVVLGVSACESAVRETL